MPGVVPANLISRAGVKETEHSYEETWVSVPFETYEGMTQGMFQGATGVFGRGGAKVTVQVPKGWRKVETPYAGKQVYVNMETGVISKFPKDLYNCKKECWVKPDGTEMKDSEVMMDPFALAIKIGETDAPGTMKAVEDTLVKKVTASPAAALAPAPGSGAPLPVCLMFPGQGSQYVKMMSAVKSLPAVADMCEKAKEILGWDLLELCLKGPESELEKTKFCQPAMYVAGLAGVEKLKAEKPEAFEKCQAVAGLSLGEYTAMCVAGVFDFETGLKLVKLRGEAMEEAAAASAQSMLSVAGLDETTLTDLCKQSRKDDEVCQIANFLFPNGFSCAGHTSAVERLLELAQKTPGCLQSKMLKTSGGFHTSLMGPAQEKLNAALKEAEAKMKPPRCDVYMNVSGKKVTPATPISEITELMGKQLTSTVLWQPSVKEMIKDGVKEFYECGPMKQLKAMMKRIDTESFGRTTTIDV